MREPSRVADEPYDEEPIAVRALREGARIVVMSLVVTAVIGGGYLMIYGRGGAQAQVAGGQTGASTKVQKIRRTTDSHAASPTASAAPSFADQVQAAAGEAAPGHARHERPPNGTARVRHGHRLWTSAPRQARPRPLRPTRAACSPAAPWSDDLVTGVADGASLSTDQARAFLLGASTLYCPKYAADFSV